MGLKFNPMPCLGDAPIAVLLALEVHHLAAKPLLSFEVQHRRFPCNCPSNKIVAVGCMRATCSGAWV